MKKVIFPFIAGAAFVLSACGSEPTVEERFFNALESSVEDMERLAEQDSVCMSTLMEKSEAQDEELMPLAEEMMEKHGEDLPTEYEARMEALSARMQTMVMELMPKVDVEC